MALPTPMIGAPINATGGVAAGEIGTTLPTDASTALAEALIRLGLVGEDGFTITRDRSTEDKRAWGGGIVRTVQTEFSETVTTSFLESDKAETLKEVYGAENVTVTPGTEGNPGKVAIKHNDLVLDRRVFVFEMKDGKRRRRIVLPNAQITGTDDVQYTHSELISYAVTMTAYPDENGNCAYEYIDG